MRGKAMAKKRRDRDFRPDKPQGSLLDKLYITKQQRETLLKWTLYGILTLLCLVIQDTFLSGIWVFGASPDLVPMVILLIGMMQSTEAGATFALCAALFYFHAGSSPGAYAVAALPLLEFALSAFRQSYLRKSIGATVFSAASALILYEILVFFVSLVLGRTYLSRFPVAILTWLMSLLAIPVLYPVCRAIDRIGGETWRE